MYTLTLCDRDGALIAVVPDAPVLPRFMHVRQPDDDGEGGAIELGDSPEPARDHGIARTVTFARVASSVWVHDDEFNCDDRSALFVRVPA